MKKIGILTFHRAVNNGAVMQCYSLSKRIQNDFPDCIVEVIDYNTPQEEKSYSGSLSYYYKDATLRSIIRRTGSLILHPGKLKREKLKKKVFYSVLNKLPLSNKTIIEDGFDSLFEYINNRYDVVVVGSDAVWNFVSRGFPSAFLLSPDVKSRKVSYAASCYGMEFLTIEEKERKQISECLNDFDFIGVRDVATEQFVEWSGSENNSIHTCDPTAFLNVDDLPINTESLKTKMKERGFEFSKPSIGVMGDKMMMNMVKERYGQKYQIVSLFNYIPDADVQLYDLNPYEWAYVFRFFKLTFTTYFHGTMLSLRNGVPVICIALDTEFSKNHTPKTLDVLTRMRFENWYFKTNFKDDTVDEIYKCADRLLNDNLKDIIIQRIDEEAQSYLSFKTRLLELLEMRNKYD